MKITTEEYNELFEQAIKFQTIISNIYFGASLTWKHDKISFDNDAVSMIIMMLDPDGYAYELNKLKEEARKKEENA